MLTRSNKNGGFTLLELLLAIVILAALATIAIPGFAMLLGDRRVVRGANQVSVKMTDLRVDAMREGRVMMMQAELETGNIRIKPYFSLSDATEAFDQTGSQSALLNGANQVNTSSAIMLPEGEESEELLELPEDIVVKSVNVVSAARAFEIEQQTQEFGAESAQPILFYPDGTTSTAAIVLLHPKYGEVTVKLRGITGTVSIGDVEGVDQ